MHMEAYTDMGPRFPPPGWAIVGHDDVHAVHRAGELAAVLPPAHFHDEAGASGEWLRFFTFGQGDGCGVACIRWVGGPAMLGDASSTDTTTPSAPSGMSAGWDPVSGSTTMGLTLLLLAGAAVLIGGIYYVASRREAHEASGYRGADTRRERDELAEQNIPSELVPLWRRERGRFRGSPHERSEAFLEWAETDEGENAQNELLEERGRERADAIVLEREGCECNDQNAPRCCGRGCCSWHKGIRGRLDQQDEVPF
jgi:hypothetical protein